MWNVIRSKRKRIIRCRHVISLWHAETCHQSISISTLQHKDAALSAIPTTTLHGSRPLHLSWSTSKHAIRPRHGVAWRGLHSYHPSITQCYRHKISSNMRSSKANFLLFKNSFVRAIFSIYYMWVLANHTWKEQLQVFTSLVLEHLLVLGSDYECIQEALRQCFGVFSSAYWFCTL